MTTEALAVLVIEACESESVEDMLTGAFATNLYGIPRATKDVDVVLGMTGNDPLRRVAKRLESTVDIGEWCVSHGATDRLKKALSEIPSLD